MFTYVILLLKSFVFGKHMTGSWNLWQNFVLVSIIEILVCTRNKHYCFITFIALKTERYA